ncbi:TPA: DUF3310 domain-containing protein [Proteus mirabilis]|uniref:DUF3310 domain-containing protein n=1 Tax=Proteus mirabilis TaxID=584 RepID=UPI002361E066|nr:DUF3310 domain-containing protein [Proteus mirabilis]MDC9759703.1 DUF3310 domain-containing protein [Proteus mirabilis]MDS0824052.1 DUF3310 domain-containing protein [Proteus mirabilis]
MTDNVNNPPHYASGDIECIDAIKASMTKRGVFRLSQGQYSKVCLAIRKEN